MVSRSAFTNPHPFDSFVVKQPIDEEPSSTVVEVWTDPPKKKTGEGEELLGRKGERARNQTVQAKTKVFGEYD